MPAQPVKVSKRTGDVPTVLIVLSTTAQYYETRMVEIRNTWMKRVEAKPSMDLIFVGEASPEMTAVPADLVQPACPVGYYEDTCKRAEMFTFAYDYLSSARGKFIDWVFFADDDVYIFPDNLQRMIMSLGQAAVSVKQVWAALAAPVFCANKGKCFGMCGGGGYFTNRATIFAIEEGVDRSVYPRLKDEAAQYDEECARIGDIAISQLVKFRRNIPIVEYPAGADRLGVPGGDAGLLASLKSKAPRPWLYHYSSRGHMDFIYQNGIAFGTDDPPLD